MTKENWEWVTARIKQSIRNNTLSYDDFDRIVWMMCELNDVSIDMLSTLLNEVDTIYRDMYKSYIE